MTALRAREKPRTILDFSNFKCSKSGVHKILKTCKIPSLVDGKSLNDFIIYNNEIKVGIFTITLQFPLDISFDPCNLVDQKDFEIIISENYSSVDLKRDSRFKNEYWVNQMFFGKFRIKHLTDAIIHCKRIDQLKAFL